MCRERSTAAQVRMLFERISPGVVPENENRPDRAAVAMPETMPASIAAIVLLRDHLANALQISSIL